jgi:hypothetical protein
MTFSGVFVSLVVSSLKSVLVPTPVAFVVTKIPSLFHRIGKYYHLIE